MVNTAAYRGPAVYIYSGSANLVNNTITRNRTQYTGGQGGGLLVWSGATASGKNNIICDNVATSGPNVYGSATLTYCNVGGGWTGTGNISSDPMFIQTPPTGYSFLSQIAAGQTQNSPCVNAGDPGSPMVTGTTRTDHVQDAGIVDMGFHWPINVTLADRYNRLLQESETITPELQGVVPTTPDLRIANYPNPFNPTTVINLTLDKSATVDLKVYDAVGRVVADLFQGNLEVGAHEFSFSGANLPAGVYVYRADVSGTIVTGKALLVK